MAKPFIPRRINQRPVRRKVQRLTYEQIRELGLDLHLNQGHFIKNGIRFFDGEGFVIAQIKMKPGETPYAIPALTLQGWRIATDAPLKIEKTFSLLTVKKAKNA